MLIVGAFAFMFQVYCDFSAYSDIAIGSARILGFDLTDNFNRPFLARSLPEVWRRWHISLTDWVNDYMYKPLRKRYPSKFGRYVAIYTIFTTIGFWHGAGWPFIMFGLVHATYVAVHHATRRMREGISKASGLERAPILKRAIDIAITFNLWVLQGSSFEVNRW